MSADTRNYKERAEYFLCRADTAWGVSAKAEFRQLAREELAKTHGKYGQGGRRKRSRRNTQLNETRDVSDSNFLHNHRGY